MRLKTILCNIIFFLWVIPVFALNIGGNGYDTGKLSAQDITVNTSAFNHNLNTLDKNVQHALNTLDQLVTGSAIGSPITGGTANEALYINGSGNLAQSFNFRFNGTSLQAATLGADNNLIVNSSGASSFNTFYVENTVGGASFNVSTANDTVYTRNNVLDDGTGVGSFLQLTFTSPSSVATGTSILYDKNGPFIVDNGENENSIIGEANGGAGIGADSGFNNVVLGNEIMAGSSGTSGNTAMGYTTLTSFSTGDNNTAIGFGALYTLGTGSNNIALGKGAGSVNSGGDSNIYIGNEGVNGESGIMRLGTTQPAVFANGNLIIDGAGIFGPYSGYYFRNIGLDAGLVLEGSQVLSYAINVSQIGTRDTSVVGGIFRLDTRTGIGGTNGGEQSFIVFGSPTGTNDFNNVISISLQTGETLLNPWAGNTSIGLTGSATAKLDVNGSVRSRGNLTIDGGSNIILSGTNGTKIGTATTQKLAFYNSTPIVQPTGSACTALQNLGLVASCTVTATTNANLTGPITSSGNATSIASQTGTGTKFVVDTSPTLVTPLLGVAKASSIQGNSSTPTIVAGTGAGTTPTVSVAGNNISGSVTVTTGTLPTGTNAIIATITYANSLTYTNSSYVVLYPANAITATLSGVSMVYAAGTTTTFVITSGTTALTAATTYLWNYHVIGN